MLSVKATFEEKVLEIDGYFAFLKYITHERSELHCPSRRSWKKLDINEDLKKVLKANAFLILYNLAESTVRAGVNEICDAVRSDDLAYVNLAEDLRKVWIHQRFREVGLTAHPDRYRDVAKDLVDEAVKNSLVQLDAASLPISGNVDAEQIRQLADKIGFSSKFHRSARGGEKLGTVRKERNKLAHGVVSFSECGRDYTFEDLHEIKRETVISLRSLVLNISRYVVKRKYAA